MAESIDELQIDIKVKDNNSAKQIDAITLAVNNLTAALSGLNKFSSVLDKLAKIKMPNVAKNLKSDIGNVTPPEMAEIDVEPILRGEDLELPNIPDTIIDESTINNVSELKDKIEELRESLNGTKSETKDTKKELKDLDKNANKSASSWSKLTRAIGRIALYRAIRSALKAITNAAKEGLSNIRTQNKELDESMKKISLAGMSLKNSFASLFAPLIQTIEPLITRIADKIATMVNKWNEAQAAMKGQSKYTKILTSDMEEYQKELDKTNGSLLEFDTFTTLSAKNSYTGVKEEDVKMPVEDAEKYSSTLGNIVEVLQEVVGLIVDIIELVSPLFVSFGDVIDGIVLQIKGAIQITRGLIKLLMGDLEGAGIDLTNGFKNMLKGILKLILGAINVVIDAINFLIIDLNPLKLILDLVGVDTSWAKIPHIPTDWTNFANGGSYQTADLFYANENGQTELIASNNSGGGAVMNMEQLRSAIYEGMVMAMSENSGSEQGVYLDGNKVGAFVAGNVGFRNEANRRNTGLNWR